MNSTGCISQVVKKLIALRYVKRFDWKCNQSLLIDFTGILNVHVCWYCWHCCLCHNDLLHCRFPSNCPVCINDILDAVLILVHSLNLLSNDLCNPSIKNKMSKREFIKNTIQALEGTQHDAIDSEYLGHTYDNVYLLGHIAPERLEFLWYG